MTGDAPAVRASDEERERAVVRLREAVADGRLTLEEFAQRMERAYTARTRAQLDALASDLPAAPAGTAAMRSRARRRFVAVMSSTRQRGRWELAQDATGVCLMGDLVLDLRKALLPSGAARIRIFNAMGNVQLVVPRGVLVELRGVNVMGNKQDLTRDDVHPSAPRVEITGFVLMGNLQVVNG